MDVLQRQKDGNVLVQVPIKHLVEKVQDQINDAVGYNFASMAEQIYDGLGGDANVTSVDNCVTRSRIGKRYGCGRSK